MGEFDVSATKQRMTSLPLAQLNYLARRNDLCSDLLQALKAARNFLADDHTPGDDMHEDLLMVKIDAAIAKAGEQ